MKWKLTTMWNNNTFEKIASMNNLVKTAELERGSKKRRLCLTQMSKKSALTTLRDSSVAKISQTGAIKASIILGVLGSSVSKEMLW